MKKSSSQKPEEPSGRQGIRKDSSAPSTLGKNRNYHRLIGASGATNLGDGIAMFAFPWAATLITRDPVLIGVVTAALRLPWFVMTLPMGVVTDRYPRRSLILMSDLFRLAVMVLFGLLILLPMGESAAIWLLAATAFLTGSAEVLRDNSAQTFMPEIVVEKDLERANGRLWSVELVMGQLIGPPLAGFLFAIALPAPFAVIGIAFLMGAVFIYNIKLLNPWTPGAPTPFLSDLATGLKWALGHRAILTLGIVLGFLNAGSLGVTTALVLYVQEILGLSAQTYGLLMTAAAFGGILGGLTGPKIAEVLGNRPALLLALIFMAIGNAILLITASPILVAASLFIELWAGMLWNVVTVSFRQRIIPPALLGRVNAIYRFFGWGMMPLGALAAGILIATFTPTLGRETALLLPFALGALIPALGLIAVAPLKITKADP